MTSDTEIQDLLESQDLDTLVTTADQMARDTDWDRLAMLRTGAIHALESGHQLWPLAARIDYLFALAGPPRLAGIAVSSPYSRFTPGPLTEVAAIGHTWADLAGLVQESHCAAMFAHERVLRGEVLDGDLDGLSHFLDLPGHLLDWEPAYSLARYDIDHCSFPGPVQTDSGPPTSIEASSRGSATKAGSSAGALHDIEDALRALTETWTSQSNGRCEVVVARSTFEEVFERLGPRRVTLARIAATQAIATMAWAGASGGAYGRRPGAAAGRFGALWAAAAIAELEWPPDFSQLGEATAATEWYLWHTGAPDTGWRLQLAFHTQSGVVGALEASDAA